MNGVRNAIVSLRGRIRSKGRGGAIGSTTSNKHRDALTVKSPKLMVPTNLVRVTVLDAMIVGD